MTRLYGLFLLMFTLLLCNVHEAQAGSVSITSSGNGTFIVNGSGMDNVAGIELTVNYDSSLLASPSVTQGSLISGALMAANTNKPGSIKVAIINSRPFAANGQIAQISFATHTGTGRIAVSSSMFNVKGSAVPGGGESVAFDSQTSSGSSSGFASNAGVPFSDMNTVTTTVTGSQVARTSSTPGYLGTVSMPSDVQATSNADKPVETSAVPAEISAPVAAKPIERPVEEKPAPEPQKAEKVMLTTYKGILDAFRSYSGVKSPAKFIELFNKQIAPTIHQIPAVALSDGKTPVKISAELKRAGDKSPNFALNGAKLVSLNVESSTSTWIVEAMPQAGILEASLTILTDSDVIEYPLTLAPRVENVSPVEADFVIFLQDSGTKNPKRDLNGDGKHDYLDDYIYTANYLTQKVATGKTDK